jgi:DNA-binding NtrC family response regulator
MNVPSRLVALAQPDAWATIQGACAAAGLEAVCVERLSDLLEQVGSRPWSGTLLSLSAPDVDEAMARRIADQGNCGSLLLAAPGASLETALLMERIGAVALLREPLDEEELRTRLLGVSDEGSTIPLSRVATEDADTSDGAPVIVAESHAMAAVLETVARVARSNTTVLVTGESGTGKEVIARAIHWASDRQKGPFVAVNCAAIPEHLLESELFGHERGAFTGAVARRMGRFERAHGGTLFLDEIGDMSLVLQAKVLRVLEDRTVERVGAEAGRRVDVRVVAATNQGLNRAREEGRFREDLYYRLAVVDIHLPPLREREADVRALALHFASLYAQRHGKSVTAISKRALHRLETGTWPGNVRELRNVMDRAVLLAKADVVRSGDLRVGAAAPSASSPRGALTGGGYPASLSLSEVESDHIRRVLSSVDGHMGRAASTLGIHRNTLRRKMLEYGIAAPGDEGSTT